jgi:bifunctional NMN adenylyltransferase/nudix hydrolase
MYRAITPISGCDTLDDVEKGIKSYKWLTSQTVINFIEKFITSGEFEQLKREHKHYTEEEKMYNGYPYAKNFLTTDAVVVQSGHVLLVRRGALPGEGLWALPGGHLNPDENALNGTLRELKEETGLKVPTKVLKGSLKKVKNFDHPDRSLRCRLNGKKGRTFTVAHCFVLDNTVEKLPRVKGADDAKEAWWFTLAEIRSMKDQIFEDHSDIIEYFIHQI